MKITIVCDTLTPDIYGTAVAAMTLVRAMKKRGHEVVVVCSDESKAGKEGYVVVSRRNSVGKPGFDKEALENAVWDSDVVHLMTPFSLGKAAVKLCKQHLIPVSADFYAQDDGSAARFRLSNSRTANHLMYRYYYNRVYRYADAIRFPSELSRKIFEKADGRKTEAYVIPNGISERFRPDAAQKPQAFRDKTVILYCAPYTVDKDHRVLIDAAARSKYNDRIQLVLAGSGPLKSALKKQGMKLKNQPVITAYPYSQLPNLYQYADLYVDAARSDPDGVSCMEALACGCAVLIADSPLSAAKQLAPDDGCLFESRNVQALADKIDSFIEGPETFESYRDQCADIAEEYSSDACMDKLEEMFFDLR